MDVGGGRWSFRRLEKKEERQQKRRGGIACTGAKRSREGRREVSFCREETKGGVEVTE